MSQQSARAKIVRQVVCPKVERALGRHAAAGTLLVAAIAGVVAVAVLLGGRRLGQLDVMDLALIWILSFLPGWLYVRFIGLRAGAIWDEFVLNLHRLQIDDPQFLPEPPASSVYYQEWVDGGGRAFAGQRNVYRQKFDAYYGRSVAAAGDDSRVSTGPFFPVVLATLVVAIGWTAVLWGGTFPEETPTSAAGVLAYGFVGAYLFNLQMLARRFFQSDLKPSAYTSVVLRFVAVGAIVLVMHQLPVFDNARPHEAIVAFVVGMFPLVGLQALNRMTTVVLRTSVPSLQSDYPLNQLDGLNVWYETRLLEEGIEDMQNLVSANLVEVILHSRVPVGRLVDWCDQAQLFLHLAPMPTGRKAKDARAWHGRAVLRTFGVHNATTYLKAFDVDGHGQPRCRAARSAMKVLAARSWDLPVEALTTIARLLNESPALRPIEAWRDREGATREPVSRPALTLAPPIDDQRDAG